MTIERRDLLKDLTKKKVGRPRNTSRELSARTTVEVMAATGTSIEAMISACEVRPIVSISVGPPADNAAVTVCVPSSQTLIHTYAAADVQRVWRLVHLKNRDEFVIVADSVQEGFGGAIKHCLLIPTVTSRGSLILWPIEVGDADTWINSWAKSAREIALGVAAETWVRLDRNTADKRYIARRLIEAPPTVDWSSFPYEATVFRAFGSGRFVDSTSHPIYRAFAGELA